MTTAELLSQGIKSGKAIGRVEDGLRRLEASQAGQRYLAYFAQ